MNKEKQFDCINFKYELQKKLIEKSGAKNLQEFVAYANRIAKESTLHKNGCDDYTKEKYQKDYFADKGN